MTSIIPVALIVAFVLFIVLVYMGATVEQAARVQRSTEEDERAGSTWFSFLFVGLYAPLVMVLLAVGMSLPVALTVNDLALAQAATSTGTTLSVVAILIALAEAGLLFPVLFAFAFCVICAFLAVGMICIRMAISGGDRTIEDLTRGFFRVTRVETRNSTIEMEPDRRRLKK